MAATEYPVGHPLAVSHWSRELMKEALKRTSYLQFMGRSKESLAYLKDNTQQDAGDNVTVGLRMQLNGAGVSGDGTLEGNEEALVTFSDQIFIDQLRHAVRSKGKMSEQRVPFSVRDEAKDGLSDWWADRYDTSFFVQTGGDNHTFAGDVRFTGMQAVVDPIVAGDTDHYHLTEAAVDEDGIASASASAIFKLSLIDRAVTKAKTISPVIRPFNIMGEKYYVMFLHPLQVEDLRTDAQTAGNWFDIQKAAMQGGDVTGSPIFTGALGVYNGVVLHENTRVRPGNLTVPASTGAVYRSVLCGAQAICHAYGMGYSMGQMEWIEELFDYGNQLGVASGCIWGLKKSRFNGKDFSTILVPTWTTNAA